MANNLYVNDAHTLMNAIAKQVLGADAPQAIDTTSFVTVAETTLRAGVETTLSAISQVLGETIFSIRPYSGKFKILTVSEMRWGNQVRKLSPLYSETEKPEDYNTYDNAAILYDGNSIDMYKISNPKAIQTNFYGSQALQKHITRYRDQLYAAFRNEAEFMRFIDMVMTEFNNEIEVINESKARATVLNYITGVNLMASTYDTTENAGRVVDLVAAYNEEFNTSYTRAQLLTTYISDFMKFIAAEIKIYSSRLTDFGYLYHSNIGSGDSKKWIPRHTPKTRQKMLMYNPIFVKAESEVYSGLFNPQYLEIGDFEGVNFWQSPQNPTKIVCKPNYMNATTGASASASDAVTMDYVLGVLFDEEALGIRPGFDYSSTTPFNSAGGYYNMFMHWRWQNYVDYTENGIVFVLGEGGEAEQTGEE